MKSKIKLTRIYAGKDVLCNYCKTKKFRTTGNKEKYGSIIIHKKGCDYIKKLRRLEYGNRTS